MNSARLASAASPVSSRKSANASRAVRSAGWSAMDWRNAVRSSMRPVSSSRFPVPSWNTGLALASNWNLELFGGDQFHLEDEDGVRRDVCPGAGGTVAEVGRN